MSEACRFPENTPYTAYTYGCRCDRCRANRRDVRRERRRIEQERQEWRLITHVCEWCTAEYHFSHPAQSNATFQLCPNCDNEFRQSPMFGRFRTWGRHGVPKDMMTAWMRNPDCWVCGGPIDLNMTEQYSPKSPAVDHDHSCCTGAVGCRFCVRGLTHRECNLIIGQVEKLLSMAGPVGTGIVISKLIEKQRGK